MVCLGISAAGTIQFYVILLYMPTFATTQLGLPLGDAFTAQSIGLACLIAAVPLFGAISDRVGRKPIMTGTYTLYLGLAYPLFVWVQTSLSVGRLMFMQIVPCSLHGAFLAILDSPRGAVPGACSRDRQRDSLQCRGHDVRRLCAIFRYLADSGNRLADRASVLRDVRRGDGLGRDLIPGRSQSRVAPAGDRWRTGPGSRVTEMPAGGNDYTPSLRHASSGRRSLMHGAP
jgi:hypothetical protein